MEKTEKKQFKELSDEQLQEVTGGFPPTIMCGILIDSCPSGKFDPQCHCIG